MTIADVKGAPAFARSDVATAIKFCKAASAKSRRALYELGRAYPANRQLPEAISAYREAADKGSPSAKVELRRAARDRVGRSQKDHAPPKDLCDGQREWQK